MSDRECTDFCEMSPITGHLQNGSPVYIKQESDGCPTFLRLHLHHVLAITLEAPKAIWKGINHIKRTAGNFIKDELQFAVLKCVLNVSLFDNQIYNSQTACSYLLLHNLLKVKSM